MAEIVSKRTRILRRVMLFWTLFIGIGACGGAACMLIKPDGSIMQMQGLLPDFQVLPFADALFCDYVFPGIALLIVNGLTNLTAAYLIFKKRLAGAYMGCAFGVTLMMWITIQFVIFPANVLSTSYFVFGALQFICGVLYVISFKQNAFYFDEKDYARIGEDPSVLVAFYSRMGYTKKVAFEKANELGAQIYEITTPERTKGLLGFMWLGRFGMHKWPLPIDEVKPDVSVYDKIVIVTPIQVFGVASPVRAFCKAICGKVKRVEYVSVHFRKDSNFAGAFAEMDKLLGIAAESRESDVCKFGRVVKSVKL